MDRPPSVVVIALAALLLGANSAWGQTPSSMWPVFDVPHWTMRSSADGHWTRFYIRHLHAWGCWRGDLVDLHDVKQTPADYWATGFDVIGNQILLRGRDGSWRMVGAYAESPLPTERWTMQIHGYPGEPAPYVVVPGRLVDSDTRTEYHAQFEPAVVSSCMSNAVPSWGNHIYWRSRFHFTPAGLVAHYEENATCSGVCQIENWTFRRSRGGIAEIEDVQAGGVHLGLVLRQARR